MGNTLYTNKEFTSTTNSDIFQVNNAMFLWLYQNNLISIYPFFNLINPSTFEPKYFYRIYQFYVYSNAEIYVSISLHFKMNHYLIIKSLTLSFGIEEQNYKANSQSYPQDQYDQYFMRNVYEVFFDFASTRILYCPTWIPINKLVFEAIRSIIHILFSSKYIIIITQSNIYEIINFQKIMNLCYPKIKQFQIIKNFWGIIISVKFHSLQVDIQSYSSSKNKLIFKSKSKLIKDYKSQRILSSKIIQNMKF
ncbi:unnamed protein product [Paramecium sonneborni]|uniref:Uncharacterized protein n=1 Tax=Paramecium sonneborni TaxID=65129 RepID=A0A8S1RMM9_9CILI|nr:unnamed protein product [Paramecium sonneborni]